MATNLRILQAFSVFMLMIAAITHRSSSPPRPLDESELVRFTGADHYKKSIMTRDCDEYNRDLLENQGFDGVPKGSYTPAGACNKAGRCLYCANGPSAGPSRYAEDVITTTNWSKEDSYDHTEQYDCGSLYIGYCVVYQGVYECIGDGSPSGQCAIINYWEDQSK